ncbi:hypothetical protein B7G54_07105 [Burkholderia puraquae]|uniref:Uncharacterized protein n=1 Tax=Burkholderia puraquae TaxID=1904757 RepID=A0A1X1PKI6_9BURK|nr:hypothetical protein B7G54_07105 [Burkholderia puraquae]
MPAQWPSTSDIRLFNPSMDLLIMSPVGRRPLFIYETECLVCDMVAVTWFDDIGSNPWRGLDEVDC